MKCGMNLPCTSGEEKITFQLGVFGENSITWTDVQDPVQALLDLANDTKVDGYFKGWHQAECFRYVNGTQAERQWLLHID